MKKVFKKIGRGLVIGSQIGEQSRLRYENLLENQRGRLEQQGFQKDLQGRAQKFQTDMQAENQLFQADENFKSREQRRKEFTETSKIARSEHELNQDRFSLQGKQFAASERRAATREKMDRINLDIGYLENRRRELMSLKLQEASKTIPDMNVMAQIDNELLENFSTMRNVRNTKGQELKLAQLPKSIAERQAEMDQRRMSRVLQFARKYKSGEIEIDEFTKGYKDIVGTSIKTKINPEDYRSPIIPETKRDLEIKRLEAQKNYFERSRYLQAIAPFIDTLLPPENRSSKWKVRNLQESQMKQAFE